MYNHQNNTFISHQIFHLFSGHVRPLTVENFGCWDIPFVWGLPNLEFGQIPPNSPNLTIWPGSFLRLVGTYLAAGYCNCNEALFPLSTLSQQENSLEQREGGGGVDVMESLVSDPFRDMWSPYLLSQRKYWAEVWRYLIHYYKKIISSV